LWLADPGEPPRQKSNKRLVVQWKLEIDYDALSEAGQFPAFMDLLQKLLGTGVIEVYNVEKGSVIVTVGIEEGEDFARFIEAFVNGELKSLGITAINAYMTVRKDGSLLFFEPLQDGTRLPVTVHTPTWRS
jgi:hypothetical protein